MHLPFVTIITTERCESCDTQDIKILFTIYRFLKIDLVPSRYLIKSNCRAYSRREFYWSDENREINQKILLHKHENNYVEIIIYSKFINKKKFLSIYYIRDHPDDHGRG